MNSIVGYIENFEVFRLTKDFAEQHIDVLTNLVNKIPLVEYTQEHILAESKEERIFFGKWDHSLVVVDQENPIACIIAYERKSESNNQYPNNSLYMSELAVDQRYQKMGIAKSLLNLFFQVNTKFKYLEGPITYAVQTNEAPWNIHVENLYRSFGFQPIGKKQYNNRTDIIFVRH